MLVNLCELSIEANADIVTFYPVNDEMKREAMEDKDNKFGQPFPRHLCLTTAEVEFARECLLGVAPFYPYFDDGIHLVKFAPDGMRETYVSERQSEMFYFTFPGKELVQYIDAIVSLAKGIPQVNSDKVKLTVPRSEIRAWRNTYAPKFEWRFHDSGVYVIKPQGKLHLDRCDLRAQNLENCCARLEQIARNHSDGIPSIINIQFDCAPSVDVPSNYYFWISAGEKQIINGGIIAHKDASTDSWKYSTHT